MTGLSAFASVFLDALKTNVRVGLNPEERLSSQPIEFDIELRLANAARDVQDGSYLDYDVYGSWLTAWLEHEPHTDLLEELCMRMASRTFEQYPMVCGISVRVHKVKLRSQARRVGVALHMERVPQPCCAE